MLKVEKLNINTDDYNICNECHISSSKISTFFRIKSNQLVHCTFCENCFKKIQNDLKV